MINRIVTGDESLVHLNKTKSKCFNVMDTSQFTLNQKFQVASSAGEVMLIVFWNYEGVLLPHFQKRVENMNSASYCEVLLKLRNTFGRRLPDQLARGALLQCDNARLHAARATQDGIQELLNSICWVRPKKKHLGGKRFADDEEVDKKLLKWHGLQSKLLCCGFRRTGKAMGHMYQCCSSIF
jgi:hypothetical protein